MNQNCIDVFEKYELPFETYFQKGIDHVTQIHDETELIWVMKGTSTIICEGQTYLLTPQTLFMVNSYQTHTITSTNDSMIIAFKFSKEHLQKNNQSFEGLYFINRVYTLSELVDKYHEVPILISQLLNLLISTNPSSLVRYKIIGYYNMLIYELYTMLLKEKYLDVKKKDVPVYLNRLNDITEYINNKFLTKITLDEISDHIGISRYRMSHFIKEYIGISFRDYLSNMRLEYALRLLRDSNLSVIDVSKLSGFSDIKYLNKLMKERFKTTALKYRKRIREQLLIVKKETTYLEDFFNELKRCLLRLEQNTF